jgi:hypothetical protein
MDKEQIIQKANELLLTAETVKKDIISLLSVKSLHPEDILNILVGIIRSTEAAFDGISGAGEQKAELVKEIWKELDEKYHLVDILDKAIKLPIYLEPFDGPAIRMGIDLLIKGIVTALNQTGVFKH